MPFNKYGFWEHNSAGGWQVDFTEGLKKIKEKEKYDKIWELIKQKNNW